MITSNERLALQRKNRKNKNQLEASQEMVNAFDKISVSVRRAYNVNRCQQDHLDNKVWTLENEYRKSMGLLAREQKLFIRSRKSSNLPFKSESKHRKGDALSSISVISDKDSIQTSFRLPTVVNKHKLQNTSSVESFKRQASNRDKFVSLKRRNERQDINKHIHLPSIAETQLNKLRQHQEKDATGKWLSRNTGMKRDGVDKQKYVASWDVDEGKGCFKTTRKSYNNMKTSSLNVNSQPCVDEPTQMTHAYFNNKIVENSDGNFNTTVSTGGKEGTENESSFISKTELTRSGTNTTSDLESILDKTTENRVRHFLKLPPIGGIHDSPSQDGAHNVNAKCVQSESNHNKKSNQVSIDISLNVKKQRVKSSLWKNLVHCRYLRLGEQHMHEHKITNKNCECNWCAMVRKSRV